MLRAIEITEENLEDLLTYDDLFLDYFNAFLALPVFPQPLYYNRLTGTFLEVEGPNNTLVDEFPRPISPPYGATDEEREHMLEWAKDERLPLFLKTQLFREFKLCKLLLRPLDDHMSTSRGGSSRMIRGYSRQTESYVSSFSNSADNSANDADFDDETMWGDGQKSAMYEYQRPHSRAVSLPAKLGLAPVYGKSGITSSRQGEIKDSSNCIKHAASAQSAFTDLKTTEPSTQSDSDGDKPPSAKLLRSDTLSVEPQPPKSSAKRNKSSSGRRTRTPNMSRRGSRYNSRQSSAVQKADDTKSVVDFDATYGEQEPDINGETYVNFGNDVVSDQQTQTDVKQLEGKHKMSLQQMKEQILGSVHGIEQLSHFLVGTAGGKLYEFWLDCEHFKDSMEEYDDCQTNVIRNALYRDIQDRHKLTLTEDAKRQISISANNANLSHTVFIRTQYDILRRMRAYWIPRFLIHKERLNELSLELQFTMKPDDGGEMFIGHDRSATSFFPSISLVNSMPVRVEHIMQIAISKGWDSVAKGGRRLDDRVKSAKPNVRQRPSNRTIEEKLQMALLEDKAAGGPFKQFLEDHPNSQLFNKFQFWEAVTEYGMAEDRSADRLLRMCHAWHIFNQFISKDGHSSIGILPEVQDSIHQTLLKSQDFVEASLFSSIQQGIMDDLLKFWIRYLKEDLKAFLDCQVRGSESPPSTAEEIEVYLDQEREYLVVRRPRPWTKRYPPSTESERGRRLRTALSMAESIDEDRRAEQRAINREKRKIMEKERKKAVRAAMRRLKESKMNKNGIKPKSNDDQEQNSHLGSQAGGSGGLDDVPEEEEKAPTFLESVGNKSLMNMFKKYLTEIEGKESINHLNLYLDVDAYFSHGDTKVAKQKKEALATLINKSYIEQGARKKVHLSDKVYNKMKNEKARPKSPTLKDIQTYITPQIEELFQSFWEHQAAEMGVDHKAMASMSKAELAMRADDSMLLGWKKNRNGKESAGSHGQSGIDLDLQSEADVDRPDMSSIPPALLKLAMSDEDFKFKKGRKLRKEQSNLSNLSGNSADFQESGEDGTDNGRETTNSQRRKHKADGRAQPTRDDKVDFLMALSKAASGQMPLKMLYFYKYLVKHGEEDGVPFVDKDLFFYCEIHKFKEGSHQHSDEEMLKRKVQSLMDCYIECSELPHCQIDVSNEVQQKTVRAVQRYLAGKDVISSIFDDAQYSVFKELLPYWAGFQKHYKDHENEKKPLTKREKERLRRLEEILSMKPPSAKKMNLPMLPNGVSIAAFTYTINDGLRWREEGAIMEDPETGVVESIASRSDLGIRQKTNLSSDTLRSRRTSLFGKG